MAIPRKAIACGGQEGRANGSGPTGLHEATAGEPVDHIALVEPVPVLAAPQARPVEPIKVLVCGAQEVPRVGARVILDSVPGILVSGEASNAWEAVGTCRRLQPDLVLLDANLQGMDTIEVIRRVGQLAPPPAPAVILLTTSDDEKDITAALAAGVRGYLRKDDLPARRLVDAIFSVARGDFALAPSTADLVVGRLTGQPAAPAQLGQPAKTDPPDPRAALGDLTRRQQDVLVQVAEGRSNAEIAASLFITEATVKSHLSAMLRKFNLRDRTQLAVLAHRRLIGQPAVGEDHGGPR